MNLEPGLWPVRRPEPSGSLFSAAASGHQIRVRQADSCSRRDRPQAARHQRPLSGSPARLLSSARLTGQRIDWTAIAGDMGPHQLGGRTADHVLAQPIEARLHVWLMEDVL